MITELLSILMLTAGIAIFIAVPILWGLFKCWLEEKLR